MGVTIN